MPADIKLARERFRQAEDADAEQRKRELADLRFYAGEQWDADILRDRRGTTLGSGVNQQVVPARPTIVVNKCLEPVRQILNQERQSDLTITLIPADDFGETAGPIDHTEIELREGLIRRIQRDSEAADARTWAFSRAAIAGRGYWRVNTRYASGKTMDQEIYIERIYNQASVLMDPAHEQPDGSDAGWAFIGVDMPIAVYKAKYPKSKVSKASDEEWRALGDEAPTWFDGTVTDKTDTRSVRVVTYYYLEHEARELAQLVTGQVVWRDELPEDFPDKQIETSRSVDEKRWHWSDIDGIQELDGDLWPGHYCPVIKVLGEELQPYDNERRAQGVVRPMRGSCEGNNYIISKFVEQVGLTPIPPWMGPAGFDEGFEAEYDAQNTRALSRLHYNTKAFDGTPIPPGAVMRTPIGTDVQHLAFGVQVFGQAIQSTSVMPETAFGQTNPTVKSGKMAQVLVAQAEMGTSNFMDNLKRSMRHEARVGNDLLYPIYGTRPGRLARMMNPQGEMSAVVIGQPFTVEGQGPQAKPQPIQAQPGQPLPEGAKEYKLTPDAEFNVAIKISKSEGTRREQESQTLGEMISADPTLMGVLGDLFFKYQDGPGHQEMSERMKAVLIPPVQAMVSGKAPVPPEVQQQIAQMQEQMQQMSELADKNKSELVKADLQAKYAAEETKFKEQQENQRAALKTQADERAQALDNLVKLAIAEISAQSQQAKIDAEQARTELGFANQHASEEMGRQHEAGQAERDRQVQTSESERDRQTQTSESEKDRETQTTEAERARQFEASQPEGE